VSGGGKNSYIKQRDERDRKFFLAGMMMGVQLAHDFIQIALRDPETMKKDVFGRERIEKLFAKVKDLDEHFNIAFSDDKEADYKQEELDANLKEIWGKDLVPFHQRYPYAKKLGYLKPRKGWVD
jgi:hypothetical protein